VHIRLLAVGDRQPSWVDAGFDSYAQRLPRQWRFRLETIATARRGGTDSSAAREAESEKILERTRPAEFLVLLDERGRQLSSRDLAGRLEDWQVSGQDLVFAIGGPDGVAESLFSRANFTWSLSTLTLPHGLARVVCAEQLYRAWSLTTGHPYHRD
jgi:23S rRNA (pseudouridine1915-N3)-methyltransferase